MTGGTPQVVQQWVDAWNARDVERVLACLADGAIYEDVPLGAINRTAAETRQFIAAAWSAFPDLRFELMSAVGDDTHAIAEWNMLGTHRGDFPGLPATGRTFEVRGVSIMELAGDRIARIRDYWDFATALRQLGVLPSATV
jgi:steroid delta-isomerase-like uncharacterized protein